MADSLESMLDMEVPVSVPIAIVQGELASEVEAPELDLRIRRDLLGRRLAREGFRTILRFGVVAVADGVAVLGTVGSAILAGAIQPTIQAGALLSLLWVVMVLLQAGLGTYGGWDARRDYTRVMVGAVAALAVVGLMDIASPSLEVSSWTEIWLAAALPMACVAMRVGVEQALRTVFRYGIGCRRVLVVGNRLRARSIVARLGMMSSPGIRIVGYTAEGDDDSASPSALAELGETIEAQNIDLVVISSTLPGDQLALVLQRCFLHGVMVSMAPVDIPGARYLRPGRHIMGWPVLSFAVPPYHVLQLLLKRTVDVVVAVLALLALLPLFLGISLTVLLSSPGPIFFRQNRPGLGGRPFPMLKFRTMRVDAEAVLKADPVLYQKFLHCDCKLPPEEDPRIFRAGHFLRASSLDELPQLVNVLLGHMSLVGPRPVVGPELSHYGESASTFLSVKPGITGYWQISGRSDVAYPERAQMDLHYITNWSFFMDVLILLMTVPAVLRQKGAF